MLLDKVSIRVDMRFSGPCPEKPLLPFRRVSIPLDTSDPLFKSPDPLNKYEATYGMVQDPNVEFEPATA
jgi:hypothetical protein